MQSTAYPTTRNFRSKVFQYDIDLSGTIWKRVNLSGQFIWADFAAEQNGAVVAIGAIDVHGIDISLDTVASAATVKSQQPGQVHRDDREISFVSEGEDGRRLRCRVVKGDGIIWMLEGYWMGTRPELEGLIIEAMSKFQPGNLPQNGFPLEDLTPDLRRGQANQLNGLAQIFLYDQQLATALALYERAIDYSGPEARFANDAVKCFEMLHKFEEGLRYMDRCDLAVRGDPYMQLNRSWFLSFTGAKDEAITVLQSLFDTGFVSDDAFVAFVNLLLEKGRRIDAISAFDKYLDQRESVPLRLIHAGLLNKEGRLQEALNVLAKSKAKQGLSSDPSLDIAVAELQLSANKPLEAISTLDALIARKYDGPYVKALRTRAQRLVDGAIAMDKRI